MQSSTWKGLLPVTAFLLLFVFTGCDDAGTFFKPAVPAVIRDIQDLITGINTFIARISAVTGLLGFQTIILFISILVISSGLSSIGLPRGRFVFLTSLVLADALWILWKDSFNPGSLTYLVPIIRANLIVLTPLIAWLLLGRFMPPLLARASSFLRRFIPGRKTGPVPGLTGETSKELMLKSISLYIAVQKHESSGKGGVTPKTEKLMADIKKIIGGSDLG